MHDNGLLIKILGWPEHPTHQPVYFHILTGIINQEEERRSSFQASCLPLLRRGGALFCHQSYLLHEENTTLESNSGSQTCIHQNHSEVLLE